jgi:hypothetical protein
VTVTVTVALVQNKLNNWEISHFSSLVVSCLLALKINTNKLEHIARAGLEP